MAMIQFGAVWPWSNAHEIENGVYLADSTILTIASFSPIGIQEHGWVKGTTWYIKISNLDTKQEAPINKKVFDVMIKRCEKIVLRDYKNKVQMKVNQEDIDKSNENQKSILIPITHTEKYVPDTRYKSFVK